MTGIKVWVVKKDSGAFDISLVRRKPLAEWYGFVGVEYTHICSEKLNDLFPNLKVGIPEQFILPMAKRVKRK